MYIIQILLLCTKHIQNKKEKYKKVQPFSSYQRIKGGFYNEVATDTTCSVYQNEQTEMCTKFRNTVSYHNSTKRRHCAVYRLLV